MTGAPQHAKPQRAVQKGLRTGLEHLRKAASRSKRLYRIRAQVEYGSKGTEAFERKMEQTARKHQSISENGMNRSKGVERDNCLQSNRKGLKHWRKRRLEGRDEGIGDNGASRSKATRLEY